MRFVNEELHLRRGALLGFVAGGDLHLGQLQIPVAVFVPDEFVDRARGHVEAVAVEAGGDLSRFVEIGSRRVKAKLTIRRDVITRGIQGFFDQALWTIAD